MEKIGDKLKILRIKNNMSQRDVAAKLNVSNKLISKWENDLSFPNLDYLIDLCRIFNVDINYFVNTKTKRKLSKKAKNVLIITFSSIFAALFIAAIVLLSVFVFDPAVNKKAYIDSIEEHLENNFDLGYYDFTLTGKVDDTKTSISQKGIVENGEVSYASIVDDNLELLINNGLVYDGTSKLLYTKTFASAKDMFADFSQNYIDDEISVTEEDVTYIRKIKNGFYIEYSDELFTRELSEREKKNIKLLDKIKGEIKFSGKHLKYMDVTIKYQSKLNNEVFEIKTKIEFNLEKPTIDDIDASVPWGNLETDNDNVLLSALYENATYSKTDFDFNNKTIIGSNACSIVEENRIYYLNVYSFETLTNKKISLEGKFDRTSIEILGGYKNVVVLYDGVSGYLVDTTNENFVDVSGLYDPFISNKYLCVPGFYALNLYNLEMLEKTELDTKTVRATNVRYITEMGDVLYWDNDEILTSKNNDISYMNGKVLGEINNNLYILDYNCKTVYIYNNNDDLINQINLNTSKNIYSKLIKDNNFVYFNNFIFLNDLNDSIYFKLNDVFVDREPTIVGTYQNYIIARGGGVYLYYNKDNLHAKPIVSDLCLLEYENFDILYNNNGFYKINKN